MNNPPVTRLRYNDAPLDGPPCPRCKKQSNLASHCGPKVAHCSWKDCAQAFFSTITPGDKISSRRTYHILLD